MTRGNSSRLRLRESLERTRWARTLNAWEGVVRRALSAAPRPLRVVAESALGPMSRVRDEVAGWASNAALRRYGANDCRHGSIEVVGPEKECRAVTRLAFAHAGLEDLGPISFRELLRAGAARTNRDVLVACVPRSLRRSLCGPDSFWLPQSVEGLVDTGRPWSDLVRTWPNARRYSSILERHELSYEVRAVDEALPAFLAMYTTYVLERFGQEANVEPEGFFRRFVPAAEIIVVSHGGKWVAAGFNVRHAKRYRLLALALSGPADRRIGAGHAYYLFSLQRAATLGYAVADLGPERPFLGDPGLRYKRGWGLRLAANPFSVGAFVFRSGRTDGFRRALGGAQMIGLRGARPWGIAISRDDPADRGALARSLMSRYGSLGIEGFDVT